MSYDWQGRRDTRERNGWPGNLIFGLLLVLLGAFFLASEQFNIDFGRYGWPVFVIAPGVLLLLVGLSIPNEGGLGAAIPGGIITAVGLVLAYQAATDTYASWAYAWALVAPGSVGVSLALFGLLHRRWDLLDAGVRTASVGLALFVGFGLFFENILGIDDVHPNTALRDALPLMAVVLGIAIVIVNMFGHRPRPTEAAPGDWGQPQAPAPPTPPAPPAS
jgi:hypothetical protein